jgi:hypothetical protein
MTFVLYTPGMYTRYLAYSLCLVACSAPVALAQSTLILTPENVSAQKAIVDKNVTALTDASKLIADTDVDKINATLTAIEKVTFASEVPADYKKLEGAQARSLKAILEARIRLADSLKKLNDYTQLPDYTTRITESVRNEVKESLSKGDKALQDEKFNAQLGTAAKPGSTVKALLAFFKAATTAAGDEQVFGKGLATDPVPAELLEKLKDGLPKLKAAFAKVEAIQKLSKNLAADEVTATLLLPRSENNKSALDDYAARVKALGERQEAITKALPGWLKTVTETVNARTVVVMRRANDMRRRKSAANAFAIVEADGAKKLLADLDDLEKAASGLQGSDNDLALARKALAEARKDLSDNIELMKGLLQRNADESELITQEVRLSYFPEVARLVQILNPTARLVDPTKGEAGSVAAAKFTDLRKLEANIREGRANIEDIKTRIQRIDAQIQSARAAKVRTADILGRALGQKQGLIDARLKLKKQLDNTTDEKKKAELETQIEGISEKEAVQDEAVKAAEADKASAETTYNTLLDEKEGLPKKRLEAETALKTEEEALNTLRKDFPLLAQQESDAFATARDNAPYFAADPIPDDPDPVRRVYLYADANSRVLYMRGNRDDVAVARETIAEFDKPAPQTKLTFYTLQINGTDEAFGLGKKPDAKKSEVFDAIEENLDAVRSGTNLVVDALRQSVAEVVAEKARTTNTPPINDPRLSRYKFYSGHVLHTLGFRGGKVNTEEGVTAITRLTLPDPARLTTLGEILFVMALADDASRDSVRKNFNEKVAKELAQTDDAAQVVAEAKKDPNRAKDLGISSADTESAEKAIGTAPRTKRKPFVMNLLSAVLRATLNQETQTNTPTQQKLPAQPGNQDLAALLNVLAKVRGVLGAENAMDSLSAILGPRRSPPTGNPGNMPLNIEGLNEVMLPPAQREILDALVSKARTDVAGTIYNLTRQLDAMPEEIRYSSKLAENLRTQYIPLVGWLAGSVSSSDHWMKQGQELLGLGGSNTLSDQLKRGDRIAFEVARLQYVNNPLSKATGRIEAADLMIRGMIDAFDDDLKRLVRLPALKEIRNQIGTNLKGVSFGGIEETSFLATNRRVARVDPASSAGLSVDEKAEIGEAATALSQLLAKQKERESVRDAVLGSALNTAAAASSQASQNTTANIGIVSLLSSLLGTPNAEPQTVAGQMYSISSGNLYKITPIFGPSGQGMRFNFDFAGTTRLREPMGTTNPLVPRIDRHTINTEVGLANLEMRQISSFDTNYQLGMPKQRTGGMPLLNMLPGVKDIPIVGYFSERGGQAPVRQKSIILAQSVLYPTVGDIVGLMLDSAVAPVTFSPEPPSQSRLRSELNPFPADGLDRIPMDNYRPGQVFNVRITLSRPVTADSTLSLQVAQGGELELIGDSSVKLVRGQDSATFQVKRSADPQKLLSAVLRSDSDDKSLASAANSLRGGGVTEMAVSQATPKRQQQLITTYALQNRKIPLSMSHLLLAKLEDSRGRVFSFTYTFQQDYATLLIEESGVLLDKDSLTLKVGTQQIVKATLNKNDLVVPVSVTLDENNLVELEGSVKALSVGSKTSLITLKAKSGVTSGTGIIKLLFRASGGSVVEKSLTVTIQP